MTLKILLSATLLLSLTQLEAQHDHADEMNDHAGKEHHHHRNEIGIANAPVYFMKEESFSYGLHLHYIHTFHESKFGLGAGYERIFDEHGHNTFGLVLSYRAVDKLNFILSPGLTIEDASPGESSFAMHAEASYEFEFGDFHLGPVFEVAYDPEDVHLSLGIHIGYGF